MPTQTSQIKALKKGEHVQLKEGGPVWVKGDYFRSEGKYELISFDDVSRSVLRKGSCVVFHGFTF